MGIPPKQAKLNKPRVIQIVMTEVKTFYVNLKLLGFQEEMEAVMTLPSLTEEQSKSLI
ncbi:hypothetical protein PRUB_a4055 [Pseudoalteromonas rubra]|uniref:Uncharacterized protein n=1 Tax=Pseudoalteromonas rubra TaxID=43658 RepID=A0A8T0C915_9GAMM|nr:hypothetical protein PRUB_a4055 [Pseudoalteromonas rubra]